MYCLPSFSYEECPLTEPDFYRIETGLFLNYNDQAVKRQEITLNDETSNYPIPLDTYLELVSDLMVSIHQRIRDGSIYALGTGIGRQRAGIE